MKLTGIRIALLVVFVLHESLQSAAAQGPGPAGSKADVDTDAGLLGAFRDQSVSIIVLSANVAIDPGYWSQVELPLQVNRSLTITGLPGSNPLLDFNRQTGMVQLCETCTLRIVNISLANSTRHGVGTLLFFRGQIGSRIELENVYTVRLVCPSTAGELAVTNQMQRSQLFADADGRQQASTKNVSYLSGVFQNAYHAIDVSFDVPLTLVTSRTFAGGFAAHYVNVVRLCWNFVSEECLASGQGLEVCLAAQTSQLLTAMQNGQGQGSAAKSAAIAVPVAVGGALLLAAGLFLLQRHNRRRAADHRLPLYSSTSKNPSADLGVVVGAPPSAGPPPARVGVAAGVPLSGNRPASVAGAYAGVATHGSNGIMHSDRQLSTTPGGSRVTFGAVTESPSGNGDNFTSGVNTVFATPAAPQSSNSLQSMQSNMVSGGSIATPPHGGPMGPLAPLAVATGGWQLTSSHITPGLQAAADAAGSTIEWGELLGAGSFGRVYKCRWAGMDVAVKVIQHDAAALHAVENEVQLQMYLQHPNIVRAFHYVTHTHKPNSTNRSSPISSARSGGGLAASIMTRHTVKTALNSSGKRPLSNQEHAPVHHSSGGRSWLSQQQQHRLSLLTHLQEQDRSRQVGSGGGQLQQPEELQQPADQALQTQLSLSCPLTPACRSGDLQRTVSPHSFTISGAISSANAAQLSSTLSSSVVPSSPRWDGYTTSSSIHRSAPVGPAAGGSESPAYATLQDQPPMQFIPFVSSSSTTTSSAAAKDAASAVAGLAAMGSSNRDAIAAEAAAANTAGRVAVSNSENNSNSSNAQIAAFGTGGNISNSDEVLSSPPPPGWPILQLSTSRESGLNVTNRTPALATGSSLRMTARGRGSIAKPTFKASEISETWLVQELCDCGTLASIAANYWSRETEDDMQMLQRLLLLQDVARGLEFLHSKNIVHSDLNANNVLVTSSESSVNGLVAKLADLGLSRVINHHRSHRTTHTFGTLSHMPPCLLREGRLSTRADVYAFGVMMWELYTGEPAWQGLHYGQFFQQVVLEHSRPEVPDDMPEDYACLMTHCWAEDPNDRPTSGAVLQCLDIMVQERMQHLGASVSIDSEGLPVQVAEHDLPTCTVQEV